MCKLWKNSLLAGGFFLLIGVFFVLGMVVEGEYVKHAQMTQKSEEQEKTADLLQHISQKALELLQTQEEPDQDGPLFMHGLQSQAFFDVFFEDIQIKPYEADSAVVPHHLIAGQALANFFEGVAEARKVQQIVLISPNHFDKGEAVVQTSQGTWQTPYGEVKTSDQCVAALVEAVDFLKIDEESFEGEHGIAGLTPFIEHAFPEATIIPLIVADNLSSEEAAELGQTLAQQFPDALVLGSIDMSHHLPVPVQEFHDETTLAALKNADTNIDLEIDSEATLKILFAYNEAVGSQKWQEVYHGSSGASGLVEDMEENTSHIIGYFSKGEPAQKTAISLHFVGDIMLDRDVRLKMNTYGVEYLWEQMERFLDGSHLTIGNLEGTVNEQASTYTYDPPFRFVFSPESVAQMGKYIDVVSLANNHSSDVGSAGQIETKERLTDMGIPYFGSWGEPTPRYDTEINGLPLTFIGYHQFKPNEALLELEIRQADAEGRFVIVMPHWGTEYMNTPNSSQRRLAELMVNAGADLIIGGHPHVVQGMEIIDDVPVLYSLGNFIFDQQIPETWPAVTVGVQIMDDKMQLHLLPIYTKNSQPTSVSQEEYDKILKIIAEASPEVLAGSIKQGIITQLYER